MQAAVDRERRPEILIVDDSPSTLQLLSEILQLKGYTTRAALSGRLALQSLRISTPDMVLLDVTMTDINGYEICRAIKANEATKDTPVIFISGLTKSIDVVKGFSVGGVDYVTKPFEIKEVVARVETHLALRRQQRALQESYAALRNLEEMRDNLVHMIVHDLRNPLLNANICLEQITAMKDVPLPPRVTNNVNEALVATQALMQMVNTILDVSRMEAGLIPLNLEPCDLIQLAQDAIQTTLPLLKTRHITLESEMERVNVRADRNLITRVFHNILNNAARFTSETGGEIHIGIGMHEGMARATIQDNGQGIPAEYHLKIFEKFFQIKGALTGERHSTGLGLTFCKLTVEAHGGQIGVQSEENKGSLFWFNLPLEGPNNPAHSSQLPSA
jgi:two-component system sensor histidine kinase/response regulator